MYILKLLIYGIDMELNITCDKASHSKKKLTNGMVVPYLVASIDFFI